MNIGHEHWRLEIGNWKLNIEHRTSNIEHRKLEIGNRELEIGNDFCLFLFFFDMEIDDDSGM